MPAQGLGFGSQLVNFQPHHMMGQGVSAPFGAPFGAAGLVQPKLAAGGWYDPPYGAQPYTVVS